LEQAATDFAFCYKTKAESIGKEIRSSVSEVEVAHTIGNKMMRSICFKYAKLVEVCKQAGVTIQMPTGNQVLLDLTNSSLKI
jgi:hypothetical protein